ncbi:MAG TPA: alpha/beta hydrolase [Candidatus Binatia bacterium]|nr:alpha/beta hydrolase [Candidatus Binatia bacterium]
MTAELPPDDVDVFVGPDLPAMKIGRGPRTLVSLPGLSLHPGHPTGQARRMALTGWGPLLDRYTVYRVGRRVRPVGTDFQEMANDVIAAIDLIGPPVDLEGASTGGIIALHVAAVRPDLVRRLVLVASGTTASPFLRARLDRVSAAVRAGRWRRVNAMIFPIGARSRPLRLVYGALGWLLGPRLAGIPDDPTLMLAELDAWKRVDADHLVSHVTCPTLVLAGDRDPVFPLVAARELADKLPDGKLIAMPRTAHDFPASAIADHISPFLG